VSTVDVTSKFSAGAAYLREEEESKGVETEAVTARSFTLSDPDIGDFFDVKVNA
jgi:hypothetical protein